MGIVGREEILEEIEKKNICRKIALIPLPFFHKNPTRFKNPES